MNNGLTITSIHVQVLREPAGKLRGFARTLNEALQLTGLRIYEGVKGLFMAYPLDHEYKGEIYKQLYYPVNKELREYMEKNVLEEYKKQFIGVIHA